MGVSFLFSRRIKWLGLWSHIFFCVRRDFHFHSVPVCFLQLHTYAGNWLCCQNEKDNQLQNDYSLHFVSFVFRRNSYSILDSDDGNQPFTTAGDQPRPASGCDLGRAHFLVHAFFCASCMAFFGLRGSRAAVSRSITFTAFSGLASGQTAGVLCPFARGGELILLHVRHDAPFFRAIRSFASAACGEAASGKDGRSSIPCAAACEREGSRSGGTRPFCAHQGDVSESTCNMSSASCPLLRDDRSGYRNARLAARGAYRLGAFAT